MNFSVRWLTYNIFESSKYDIKKERPLGALFLSKLGFLRLKD